LFLVGHKKDSGFLALGWKGTYWLVEQRVHAARVLGASELDTLI
jgi:hypothetical protein